MGETVKILSIIFSLIEFILNLLKKVSHKG